MAHLMHKLWFVTNPNSGSASKEKCDAIEAVFEERGLKMAGRSYFPEQPLPDGDVLAKAGVDTIVLFAGDGTVNATLCALAKWDGAFLILPGGTMNMLAKALHDTLDPHEIIHRAHEAHRLVAMPFVETGRHRAFVGLILGPAAQWFRAREAARSKRIGALIRAVRHAWGRTFGRGIRISGSAALRRRYQAVFVRPDAAGLQVSGIDARDWGAVARLGWEWISGDWIDAGAVTHTTTERLRIEGRRPVLALFDGEPERLEHGTAIVGGMSEPRFIATRSAAEAR